MKVFISYAHDDSIIVNTITSLLEHEGISYFRYEEHTKLGESITEIVSQALSDCSVMLVIISSASLGSSWVQYEIGQADARGKKVLPYLTNPDLASKLPLFLIGRDHTSSKEKLRKYLQDEKQAPSQPAPKVERDLYLKLEFTFENEIPDKSESIFLGDCKGSFEFKHKYQLKANNRTKLAVYLKFGDREI